MNFLAALLAAGATPNRIKVNTPDLLAADSVVDPSDASCSIVWQSAGTIQRNGLFLSDWLVFGTSGLYELFVEGTGDTPAGTGSLNTWQNMNADLGYALSQTSTGSKSFTGTYQIRLASGHGVVGSGTLNLTAVVE